MSAYLDTPALSLEQRRDELARRMKVLSFNDPARAILARAIVGIEDQIAAKERTEFLRLRWAEEHRPNDPALTPRRKVDPAQLPLPDFSTENAL